jgi:hypothetical protein
LSISLAFHDSLIFAGATASVVTWLLPGSDVPRLGWSAQSPDVRSSASTEHGGSLRARREEVDVPFVWRCSVFAADFGERAGAKSSTLQ